MDNLYLGHLSRPQLVNLLLRIVDLLAQPLPQPEQPLHPGQAMQAPPILEPYDASISPDVRRPRPMHGTVYPTGPLNPGATAFYPMVPGANCSQRAGVTSEPSPEPAPGLPHFGACPQADLTPFTLAQPPPTPAAPHIAPLPEGFELDPPVTSQLHQPASARGQAPKRPAPEPPLCQKVSLLGLFLLPPPANSLHTRPIPLLLPIVAPHAHQ